MKRFLLTVLFYTLFVGAPILVAYTQVAYMEKSRSAPQVVVIEKILPDSAQVCAEPQDGGLVACRPVGEFRKCVREIPSKAK